MIRAIRTYALSYPFLLVGAFFVTWIAARLSLGHWPRPYLDDPKTIGAWVDVPDAITAACVNFGLPLFLIALAVLILQAFRDPSQRKHLLTTAAVSVFFMIAAIFFFWWDPLRILEWVMD